MIRIHSPGIALCVGTLAIAAAARNVEAQGVPAQIDSAQAGQVVQTWTVADAADQTAGATAQDEQKLAVAARRGGKPGAFVAGMATGIEIGGEVVTGAPYSADVVTEMTQTLADGNRIVRKQTASVARDSQGRTRRDMSVMAVGSWVPEQAPKFVMIHDPVGGFMYTVDERRQTASRQPLPPGAEVAMAFEGGGQVGAYTATQSSAVTVTSRRREGGATAADDAPPLPPPPPPPGAGAVMAMPSMVHALDAAKKSAQTESLGTQTIEGVEAVGTRTTVTIPAGEIGNEQPIRIVSESWFSADLKTPVLTKRDDPRVGETVYRLMNISRAEPAASLFEVPAGYTITEEPGMRFRVGRP